MIRYLKKRKGFVPLALKDSEDEYISFNKCKSRRRSVSDRFDIIDITMYDLPVASQYVQVVLSSKSLIHSFFAFYGGIVLENYLVLLVVEVDGDKKQVLMDEEFYNTYSINYVKEILKHLKPLGITKYDIRFISKENLTTEFCTSYSVTFNDFSLENRLELSKKFLQEEKSRFV